ncbi:GPI ethanolamine phosphate transferase 3 isoform X2 [Bacillus rossius redtenbacheri]|uniref:GPI ethanolamine phosphate transferase 3 isoform X2 n=1 Tax=Bacillus rossius redtenbacheri TaxID=93214 RepID=UPI002FDE1553
MSRQWKYFLVLLWFSYIFVSGVVLFMRGFLLHKKVYLDKSTCESQAGSTCSKEHGWCRDEAAACRETSTRVVLLLVDALRYDFAEWQGDDETDAPPYHNKLRVLRELLAREPGHARLWRFLADPPTTTAQRLKALATGSLPTFVDAGANFAAPELREDNVVDQLVAHGRPVVLMGDDTWTGLLPGRFVRQYPFPSFDVRDLDSVDEGVRRHLGAELARRDWALLVAHLLGVDHCGHRYGPHHPEMARKLREVDQLVREVAEAMDNNTLLFVVGDHGMTSTGDHGGDSEAEVTSAMFVYSKRPLLSEELEGPLESINQVDLVPTLAAALGVPIPFSSLGRLVLAALPSSGDAARDRRLAASAMRSNVEQVARFVAVHAERSGQFPEDQLHALADQLALLERNGDSPEGLVHEARTYVRLAKKMCEEVWVQFDTWLMSRGLLIVLLALLLVYWVGVGLPQEQLGRALDGRPGVAGAGAVVLAAVCGALWSPGDRVTVACSWSGLASLLVLAGVGWQHRREIAAHHEARRGLSDSLVLAASLCVSLSNSYVQEEAGVLSYLLLTVVWLQLWRGRASPVAAALVLGLSVAVRLSHAFWAGRDGQRKPRPSAVLVAPVALGLVVTVARMWMRSCGNLVGFSPTVVVARYLPSVVVVCTGGYWALQGLPRRLLLPWHLQLLPWVAYALVAIALVCLCARPLCVFCAPQREVTYGQEDAVPRLFQHVKELMQEGDERSTPVVYGLATAYSAAFGVAGLFVCLLAALLLGSVYAQGLVLFVAAEVLLLVVMTELRPEAKLSVAGGGPGAAPAAGGPALRAGLPGPRGAGAAAAPRPAVRGAVPPLLQVPAAGRRQGVWEHDGRSSALPPPHGVGAVCPPAGVRGGGAPGDGTERAAGVLAGAARHPLPGAAAAATQLMDKTLWRHLLCPQVGRHR